MDGACQRHVIEARVSYLLWVALVDTLTVQGHCTHTHTHSPSEAIALTTDRVKEALGLVIEIILYYNRVSFIV